jgi:hypothetical protein
MEQPNQPLHTTEDSVHSELLKAPWTTPLLRVEDIYATGSKGDGPADGTGSRSS